MAKSLILLGEGIEHLFAFEGNFRANESKAPIEGELKGVMTGYGTTLAREFTPYYKALRPDKSRSKGKIILDRG